MRILFITANRLGDAVLSTGILAWLVKQYPDARFTIACGPYASGLFRAVPQLEALHILRKQSWNRHWFGLWRACAGTRWDIIVDLRNSIVTRLLRADKKFYRTHASGKHKVIDNAAALGITPPPAPTIWLDAQAEHKAATLLPEGRPVLALGPAANWPPKQWPVERFAELAQRLTASGATLADALVLVVADEKEHAQIAPLLQSIPDARRVEVIGRDLSLVAACLKRARLFVGNDSGLMHMAAAVGVPTLGLFGPSYEDIYGPWGAHCAFVRTPESRETLLARLPHPGARTPNLMGGLTVDMVNKSAEKLLAGASHKP